MKDRFGTCPDCGRDNLGLKRLELLPQHKPRTPTKHAAWPNPTAVKPNGFCKGGGRWTHDRPLSTAAKG